MKKLLAILMCTIILFSMTSCTTILKVLKEELDEIVNDSSTSSKQEIEVSSKPINSQTTTNDQTWAIYWYLCGSDLESENGSATADLLEMIEVSLPENVTVLVQTGGANSWDNDLIDANKSQIYAYTCEGFELVSEKAMSNMGDAQTLVDFLTYAQENYPADNTMLNFWNHGGGSLTGVAFDEQFGDDSLTLNEMYYALESVYSATPEQLPLDIVGFDTCLMATLDTAYIFCDHAQYLVASEETEPGNGWYYTGFLQALADNTSMSTLDFAKIICDAYVEGCEIADTEDSITLSVTNLEKIPNLLNAFEDYGKEALTVSINSPEFLAEFARTSTQTENYGGNTRKQGYTNMVDIGSLVEKNSHVLSNSSQELVNALNDCVEYKIDSVFRSEGHGLSCYVPLDSSYDNFSNYAEFAYGLSMKYFYEFLLTGELATEAIEYLDDTELSEDDIPEVPNLYDVNWVDHPVSVDENGYSILDLGPQANSILQSVTFDLYYVDEDIILSLGVDDDIFQDWENGVFKDNFRGVWGAIDDNLCYMSLDYRDENCNKYLVPVMINGVDYNLIVVYDFDSASYYIDGASKPIDESGAADKNIYRLRTGDVIDIIHYYNDINSESDELVPFVSTSITVGDTVPVFSEALLGEGEFLMVYQMVDMQGNMETSQVVNFTIDAEGYITTSVYE